MRVLVTGAAGFIGMHLAARLRVEGADVTGVDSFDPYYDVALKRARAARLEDAGVRCESVDLADSVPRMGNLRPKKQLKGRNCWLIDARSDSRNQRPPSADRPSRGRIVR